MYEVFPILAGVAIAIVLARVAPEPPRLRFGVLTAFALAVGVLAAWISGELARSWGFVLLDAAQVLLAALLTTVLLRRLEAAPQRR